MSIPANNNAGAQPVRLALIGLGRWGRVLMRAIGHSPAVELVRIATSSEDASSVVPAECAIDRDWRDTVRRPEVQGVVIATPPATHAAIARAAMDAGKPVLIEKPLTLDVSEAAALLAHAESLGAIVLVDHVHLFHPAYRRLKEEVRAAGGPIRLRSVNGGPGPRRTDTSVLWDWGAHEVAIALDLVGADADTASVGAISTDDSDWTDQCRLLFSFPGACTADALIGIGFPVRCRMLAVETRDGAWVYDEHAPAALVRLAVGTDIDAVLPGQTPSGAVPVATAPGRPLEALMAKFAAAVEKTESDLEGLRLGVRVVRHLHRLAGQQP